MNISAGITAFLDVLGFGERVLNAVSDEDVKGIIEHVQLIQKEFDFKPKDESVKEIHAFMKKTVLAFSDSVVVNVPLESSFTRLQGSFDPVMSELSGMALAQGNCTSDGLFLRGGVDLGWWHRRGQTLVSQSLVGAYRTEQNAKVPVIALSTELYKYLSNHSDRKYYSPDADPLKILRPFRGLDGTEATAFWYLDYISICAEGIDWHTSRAQQAQYLSASSDDKERIREEGYVENLRRWFSRHARAVEKASGTANSASVKAKYKWLGAYHNEVAVLFTKDPSCECNPK